MNWASWLHLHLIRWEVWTAVTLCLAGALVWLHTRPRQWPYAPWLLLLAWLACAGLDYLVSDWHRVLYIARRTWTHGTIAVLAIGMIPVFVVFVSELALYERIRRPAVRGIVTATAGLLSAFLLNAPVARWIQEALR